MILADAIGMSPITTMKNAERATTSYQRYADGRAQAVYVERRSRAVTTGGFYSDIEGGVFGRLVDMLNRLDAAQISYRVDHTRPDSIMIDVAVPGWRWEIEFMADGSLDIERYQSLSGVENDPELIEILFRDNAD